MIKYKYVFPAIIFSLLLLSSCTIEKRVYLPGYHIEMAVNKHRPDAPPTPEQLPVQVTLQRNFQHERLQVSAQNGDAMIETEASVIKEPVRFVKHLFISPKAKAETLKPVYGEPATTLYKEHAHVIKGDSEVDVWGILGLAAGVMSLFFIVLAILMLDSIFFALILACLATVLGALGVNFGGAGLRKANEDETRKGLSIAAMILGGLTMICALIMVFAFFFEMANTME